MKKLMISILSIIMVLSFTCFFAGCNNNNEGEQPKPTVTVSTQNVRIILGDSYYLTAVYSEESWVDFTWQSSNDSVATVDKYGVVQTKSIGTTKITATYGDYSGTCEVQVVMDTLVPTIFAKHGYGNEVTANSGGKYTFNYSVMFNKKLYEDGIFTYESSNESVGTVDENGEFTALTNGETTITVIGKWNGNEYASLIDVITIKVVDDVRIDVNNGETSKVLLYTVAQHDGESFETTADFNVKIEINGASVSDYTVEVEDQNIASYSNGVITAISGGQTKAKIVCGDYYKEIPVEVTFPVTNYKYGTIDFSALTGELDVDGIFEKQDVQIVKATQGEKELTIKDNKIFGLEISRTAMTSTQITVLSDVEGYIIDLNAATMIVDSAEDFVMLFDLNADKFDAIYDEKTDQVDYNNDGDKKDKYTSVNFIDGYCVLTEDIVLDSPIGYSLKKNGFTIYGGFVGTFDGQGHKITAPVNEYGLFGQAVGRNMPDGSSNPALHSDAYDTTFKNLNLDLTVVAENAKLLWSSSYNISSARRSAVKDSYIKVSGNVEKYDGLYTDSYCYVLANVIYDLSDLSATSGYAYTSTYNIYTISGAVTTRSNIFVISDLPLAYKKANTSNPQPLGMVYALNKFEDATGSTFTYTGAQDWDTTLTYKFEAKGMTQYSSMMEFVSNATAHDFSAFNADIFERVTGVPTIKTDDYVLKVGKESVGPYTMLRGDVLTVTLKSNGMNVPFTLTSSNSDVVKVEGNTITGMANGEAFLTISYQCDGREIVKELPVIIGTVVEVEGEFEFSALDGDLDLKAMFGTEDITITSAYEGEEKLTVENNKLIGLETDDNEITYKTITFFTTLDTYKVRLKAYRLIIDEAKDLYAINVSLEKYNEQDGLVITGYYKMANDIDATVGEKVVLTHMEGRITTIGCMGGGVQNAGFAGTFDGAGHTLKIELYQGGLFCCLLNNATIKDININAVIMANDSTVLAYSYVRSADPYKVRADAPVRIENVNIIVDRAEEEIENYLGVLGAANEYFFVKNLFVDQSAFGVDASRKSSLLNVAHNSTFTTSVASDVYVISKNYLQRRVTSNKEVYGYGVNETFTPDSTMTQRVFTAVERYLDKSAMAKICATEDLAKTKYAKLIESGYWTVVAVTEGGATVGYIPQWQGVQNA